MVATAWAQTPAKDDPAAVLAPGDPALTEGMVDRLTAFLEWMLQAPVTAQQGTELRDNLVESWKKGDRAEIDAMNEILGLETQVAQHPPAERDLLREQLQPALLVELRKQPDDAGGRWALGVYEAAHVPIAAGHPPLTRQVSDAYAEVLAFVISQVLGNEVPASTEFKDQFAQSLVADYPNYDAAAQANLAKMPMYWAAIRLAWPALPADQQDAYREQWTPGVTALLGAKPAVQPEEGAAPAAEELTLESQDAKGYADRAAAYAVQSQYVLAIADADRAIQLDPRCASAYLTRAEAYNSGKQGLQDTERSLADYGRAIEADPKSWFAYRQRGIIFAAQGEQAKADADWAKMRALKQAQETTGDARADSLKKLQEHQETIRWASEMSRLSHEASMAVISNIGAGWTYEYRY
jgi:tetratricopeptide (TPR) repeat protein